MSIAPIMIDLEGTSLSSEEKEILNHPLVGGVIFFARNFESAGQIQALVESIHKNTSQTLLTCVDQEGGRVQRFKDGFTALPPLRPLGELYDESIEQGMSMSKAMGWLMASEVLSVGVDFSFSPVLDIDYGTSEVIGDRAFHSKPAVVSQLARAYVQGMAEAGMPCVGKHFPGHGAVEADSHLTLPEDTRATAEIMEKDVLPFSDLISMGVLQGIMPAHVVYRDQDVLPAGFSKIWLQQILRKRLNFEGVIFSDDLNMAAAGMAGSFPDRANLALEAGCDMALVCNNRVGAIDILDNFRWKSDKTSVRRLMKMKASPTEPLKSLQATGKWKAATQAAAELQK